MRVRKLDANHKREVRQFVNFQFDLYRACPQWVPPLVSSAKDILNKQKHPFYRHSIADFFVVESEGQVLGRMAMLENRNYNRYRRTRAAFFGYFDVVEDIAAARLLFKTAVEWAARHNLNQIIGPRGVMGVDGSVLVEGFEHRSALSIPYNYPYYDRFILDSGFEKDADYLSGYYYASTPLSERHRQLAERVKARSGFWIKNFTSKAALKAWIPRIHAVHDDAFNQLHTYYPPTEAEVDMIIETLMTIADPRLIKLIMHHEQIVGFLFGYPDISAGLQKAGGRLWPWGWYHILRDRRQTDWINVNAFGLLPAYWGSGATILLYVELEKLFQNSKINHAEVIQVEENNSKSLTELSKMGVNWYKRHRHYKRSL